MKNDENITICLAEGKRKIKHSNVLSGFRHHFQRTSDENDYFNGVLFSVDDLTQPDYTKIRLENQKQSMTDILFLGKLTDMNRTSSFVPLN